jgi:hypothetical protein
MLQIVPNRRKSGARVRRWHDLAFTAWLTAAALGRLSAPVSRNATVIADEHASYNDLAGLNKLKRVDHSKVY